MMNLFGHTSQHLETSIKDPLNELILPIEIREIILDYLPICDLLNASLVSKLWYQSIGSSLSFKRKISLNIHAWDSEDKKDPNVIRKSSRSYEIFSIRVFKTPKSEQMKMLANKNWHKVVVNISKISTQNDLLKFMRPFADTVKDLKIMNLIIRELNTNKKVFLPSLERLVLSDISLDSFDLFIEKYPLLKVLSLRFITADILSPKKICDAILDFLKRNNTVKDLELHQDVTNNLFIDDKPSKLSLKLKNLTVGLNNTSPDVRQNIEKFIISQSESIERLKFVCHQKFDRQGGDEWNPWNEIDEPWRAELAARNQRHAPPINEIQMMYNIWNSMNALKFFGIRFLKDTPNNEVPSELIKSLRPKVQLTTIYIQFMNCNVTVEPMFLPFLKNSPSVETIYVTKLTRSLVRFAAVNLRALRNLICYSMEDGCQKEYNDLKLEGRLDVNNFITIEDRCAFG